MKKEQIIPTETGIDLKDLRSQLVSANMQGNENLCTSITNEVGKIYGIEYASKWRLFILEEHAQRRIKETSTSITELWDE